MIGLANYPASSPLGSLLLAQSLTARRTLSRMTRASVVALWSFRLLCSKSINVHSTRCSNLGRSSCSSLGGPISFHLASKAQAASSLWASDASTDWRLRDSYISKTASCCHVAFDIVFERDRLEHKLAVGQAVGLNHSTSHGSCNNHKSLQAR